MTSTAKHPSYDQLKDLPAYAEQPVPIAFEDNNGHLNVRHYLGIGSEGLDESLVDLGIPVDWPIKAGHACFAVSGPVEKSITLETGDSDREKNMWVFAKAALDLLQECVREAA